MGNRSTSTILLKWIINALGEMECAELNTFDSAQEPVRGSNNHGNKALGRIKAFFFFLSLVLLGSNEPPLKYI